MKKLLLTGILMCGVFLALFTAGPIAQTVTGTVSGTFTIMRVVKSVKVDVLSTDRIQLTGNYNLLTLDGASNVVNATQLMSVVLSGTNLDNALSKFNLPSSLSLKTNFDAMLQDAWTNSLVGLTNSVP